MILPPAVMSIMGSYIEKRWFDLTWMRNFLNTGCAGGRDQYLDRRDERTALAQTLDLTRTLHKAPKAWPFSPKQPAPAAHLSQRRGENMHTHSTGKRDSRSHGHSYKQRIRLADDCVLQRGDGRVEEGCTEFTRSNDQPLRNYAQHLSSQRCLTSQR